MVLTDRQRNDLHAGIYEYLCSRPEFVQAAEAVKSAAPDACERHSGIQPATHNSNSQSSSTPLLEKKWTAIPRLQKKVLELEKKLSQSSKIHAHRDDSLQRRNLPRMPADHILSGHSMVVTCVTLHPLFTICVSGSEDGTIKVWDHESGDYIRTLKGHTNTINDLSFCPTGTHLASCSTDLSIKLWDVSSYACLRTLRGHDHTISAIRFLPKLGLETTAQSKTGTGVDAALAGSVHVLSASRDGTVKLWDVETGFCDHTFGDHTDWVRTLTVRRSDGSVWASSGNDQAILVYDSVTKQKISELRGHEHVVESIAFICEEYLKAKAPNKHLEMARDYLCSGSRDRTVRLWKLSENACVGVFKAHENWVRSVLIHPSGNYLISSSDDKTIRVFDIKNNRCLRTLENAHSHFVTTLDMHATLPILVSGSVDQTVRCWMLQ